MIEEWESELVLATRLAQESLQQSVAALVPMAFQPIAMQRLARRG
jgi:quinol monooxygenase YgiN